MTQEMSARDAFAKKIEGLPVEKLIARMYSVIDSNADGRLTKKEVQCSPCATMIHEWDKMNTDGDGVISRVEWTEYWAWKDEQMSNAEFKAFLTDGVFNCDIDVSDLVAATKESKAQKRLNMISAEAMAARIFTVLDTNSDGGFTLREVMGGPMAESMSGYMKDLDTDSDGKVTVTEWNSFLAKRERAYGSEVYKQFLRDIVWESDVDCSDLVSADFKAVEHISTLGSDMLIEKIWDVLDSDASGSVEKNELLYSSIKEFLIKDWADIDSDGNGRVTKKEWQSFMKKLKRKKGEVEFRKFVAYMVYQGDIDVSDLFAKAAAAQASLASSNARPAAARVEKSEECGCTLQ